MMGPSPRYYIPSFLEIGPAVPEKKIYIWAWGPSWLCDLDAVNKLLFPHPMEAPHEIWLQIGLAVSEKKTFENVDRHTDNGLAI